MIINVGDTIKANHGRTGEIINIGIATEATDIAAENDTALNAKTYDTDLNYTGAITFTGENGTYWYGIVLVYTFARSAIPSICPT